MKTAHWRGCDMQHSGSVLKTWKKLKKVTLCNHRPCMDYVLSYCLWYIFITIYGNSNKLWRILNYHGKMSHKYHKDSELKGTDHSLVSKLISYHKKTRIAIFKLTSLSLCSSWFCKLICIFHITCIGRSGVFKMCSWACFHVFLWPLT